MDARKFKGCQSIGRCVDVSAARRSPHTSAGARCCLAPRSQQNNIDRKYYSNPIATKAIKNSNVGLGRRRRMPENWSAARGNVTKQIDSEAALIACLAVVVLRILPLLRSRILDIAHTVCAR
ncbi:hypothetical protein EVAR_58091_1 [Eumeta japonica]|uniref:Uncharacterized protein n=1 Tax=Eumeta variegata TaxID=151549 RepID=A0A4C1YQD8_EUMVA|nr:hypothetical protein EVAR_58091_1 [Eumeta japonica]